MDNSKTDKYLDQEHRFFEFGNDKGFFFIDCSDWDDYSSIKTSLICRNFKQINVADFSPHDDDFPSMENVLYGLESSKQKCFVIGLDCYLRFLGKKYADQILDTLFDNRKVSEMVILSYAFRSYLPISDVRKNRRICLCGSPDYSKGPSVIFVSNKLPVNSVKKEAIGGLKNLLFILPDEKSGDIFVVTKHVKSDFPFSQIDIKDVSNCFDAISFAYPDIALAAGAPSQKNEYLWEDLAQQLSANDEVFESLLSRTFHRTNNLEDLLVRWDSFTSFQRFLLLLDLKIEKNNPDSYLGRCLQATIECDPNLFVKNLFNTIFDLDSNDPLFEQFYAERKTLLEEGFSSETDAINYYCNFAKTKGKEGLKYLTDNTDAEKYAIIEIISKQEFKRDELLDILHSRYLDLYHYLSPFDFKNDLLNSYFQDYKFEKIANRISAGFLSCVEEQAKRRDFNSLPHRDTIVDQIQDKPHSYLYFFDALGVEFLSFISYKCQELGLLASIKTGHCDLPSITSINKSFYDTYPGRKTTPQDGKKLDQIIHKGDEGFNYQNNNLPVHLAKELEIIDQVLRKCKQLLSSGAYLKVVVASDHGASRLAVIKQQEYKVDVGLVGQHSGRCCLINSNISSDDVLQIPYITKENGYYVLADYGRFKGSRASCVEVHGGASLEEVVVPIIELTNAVSTLVCKIASGKILFSFNKPAKVTVVCSAPLKEPKIIVNGLYQSSGLKASEGHYDFFVEGIKRAGVYQCDVFDGGNLVCSGLAFTVESAAGSVNDDFF